MGRFQAGGDKDGEKCTEHQEMQTSAGLEEGCEGPGLERRVGARWPEALATSGCLGSILRSQRMAGSEGHCCLAPAWGLMAVVGVGDTGSHPCRHHRGLSHCGDCGVGDTSGVR